MKKKVGLWLLSAVAIACIVYGLTSCSGMGVKQETAYETITISYESVAMMAFPSVKVYIDRREQNGSLVGEPLAKAKANYMAAVALFKKAGNLYVDYISGTPGTDFKLFPMMLRQVAIMLADLSGGSVQANTLTIPK